MFVTLTNNDSRDERRGRRRLGAAALRRSMRANPRAKNLFGHIVKWMEADGDPAATSFKWVDLSPGRRPEWPDKALHGNIKGDAFACPDGLWFDPNEKSFGFKPMCR